MSDERVRGWVERYERLWRTPGTDQLGELFTDDATYSMGPFEEPRRGLDAIRELWEQERTGPDEDFELTWELVAADPRVVLRVDVHYLAPHRTHYRDLWILELSEDGRCRSFEEWPFLGPAVPEGP